MGIHDQRRRGPYQARNTRSSLSMSRDAALKFAADLIVWGLVLGCTFVASVVLTTWALELAQ